MSYNVENLINNKNINVLEEKGPMIVYEWKEDLSVTPGSAIQAYFASKMNVRKRQVVCDVTQNNITLQAGAMQWMVGDVNMTTGIKGAADFIKKAARGSVTGESAIKPEYTGKGLLVLEPTYKHVILMDISEWGGSVVLDDGLFLACEASVQHKAVMRQNVSSAVAGGHGLWNLGLSGKGVVALEADCPRDELVLVNLQDDVLKIDGNLAVAWSSSLKFTVERAGKSLIGSAASGEGLVNVFRGTGRIWMMPLKKMPNV